MISWIDKLPFIYLLIGTYAIMSFWSLISWVIGTFLGEKYLTPWIQRKIEKEQGGKIPDSFKDCADELLDMEKQLKNISVSRPAEMNFPQIKKRTQIILEKFGIQSMDNRYDMEEWIMFLGRIEMYARTGSIKYAKREATKMTRFRPYTR